MGEKNPGKPRELRRTLIDMSAGAIAGAMSRTATSPLDVIKSRIQVQLEPTASWALTQKYSSVRPKYNGLLQTTRDIFREEGFRGFWRGNVPALLMYVQYASIQFAVLNKVKSFASKAEDHALSPYLSYISGSLGGCAATVGSYPCDLLRTVLGSQGEPKVYPNMRSACVGIVKTRGVKGLYAGLSPTLIQIIPYAGLQFRTYDTFKRWTAVYNNRFRSSSEPSKSQLFLCGLALGTVSKVVCHPLDVVKKRYQIEGLQRHPKYGVRVEVNAYKSMFDAFGQILRTEGWNGLYKGIFPSTIKAAPAAVVTFFTYEVVSQFFETV